VSLALHSPLILQPLCCLYEIPAWTMRGLGYSTLPAAETMFGICAIRILWIFTVFAHTQTLNSLFLVFPVTWILTAAMVLITFFIVWKKKFSSPIHP